MRERSAQVWTSPRVAKAISELTLALVEEYGCDHSFSVVGRGGLIAASNFADGKVSPVAREERKRR